MTDRTIPRGRINRSRGNLSSRRGRQISTPPSIPGRKIPGAAQEPVTLPAIIPPATENRQPKVLALCSSPRTDGNSRALAEAALEGAAESGSQVELVQLSEVIAGLVGDCRKCRRPDGRCSIQDGYRSLLLDQVLPADGLVIATPLYFYGVSSYFKAFLDRIFCYIAKSAPESSHVIDTVRGKQVAVCISSEESYEGSRLSVLSQFHELERYLGWTVVGTVTGIGNSRGEVYRDPANPISTARELGRNLFEIEKTNYSVEIDRPGNVWP